MESATSRLNLVCPICTDSLFSSNTGKVTVGTCGHLLHETCLKNSWTITNGGFCPHCKKTLGYAGFFPVKPIFIREDKVPETPVVIPVIPVVSEPSEQEKEKKAEEREEKVEERDEDRDEGNKLILEALEKLNIQEERRLELDARDEQFERERDLLVFAYESDLKSYEAQKQQKERSLRDRRDRFEQRKESIESEIKRNFDQLKADQDRLIQSWEQRQRNANSLSKPDDKYRQLESGRREFEAGIKNLKLKEDSMQNRHRQLQSEFKQEAQWINTDVKTLENYVQQEQRKLNEQRDRIMNLERNYRQTRSH